MIERVDPEAIEGASVYDANGELIGTVRGAFILDGELVNFHVELDEEIATLPGIGVDEIRVAPEHLDLEGKEALHMHMTLRDALAGHAPPTGRFTPGGR